MAMGDARMIEWEHDEDTDGLIARLGDPEHVTLHVEPAQYVDVTYYDGHVRAGDFDMHVGCWESVERCKSILVGEVPKALRAIADEIEREAK